MLLLLLLYIVSVIIDIMLYYRLVKDYKALKERVSLLENKEINL